METLLYRYRNITVLLVALFSQLMLIAWQVKSDNDVPLVRVWAITAVTPVASAIETARNFTTGFFGSYFALRDARAQSRRYRTEVDRLRIENQLLKNELATAQRVEAMAGFQAHNPSKMIGARVIGTTTGPGSRSLLIDRGTASGVRKGMAVVTSAGIVGKVLAVYPFASQVMPVTDPGFAAGVESQKNHVHGVFHGLGSGAARVDYIPAGQKVEPGEMFFTSGEDRVYPKGLEVGKVTGVREGTSFQDIFVQPSGADAAPEEVLVIVDPIHQEIPEAPAVDTAVFLAPDVPRDVKPEPAPTGGSAGPTGPAGAPAPVSQYSARPSTQADKMMEQYRKIGASQNHTFGEGGPGSIPPDFNKPIEGKPASGPSGPTGKPGAAAATAAPRPAAPRPAPPVTNPAPPVPIQPPQP